MTHMIQIPLSDIAKSEVVPPNEIQCTSPHSTSLMYCDILTVAGLVYSL